MKVTYEAVDTSGRQVRSTMHASSVQEGVDELRRKGLMVTQATSDDTLTTNHHPATSKARAKIRLPLQQLLLFTRQMAMLLNSGSAIVPALAAIRAQMKNPEHQQMLDAAREDLEQGLSLTDSLRKSPKSFDASYCAVVAAGESSATLPAMFTRLANLIQQRRVMRNKVIGALIYPLLLTCLSVNILSVLVFFVVPRFAGMFASLGVDLPFSTRVIMAFSTLLRSYWPVAILLVGGVVAGSYYLIRTDRGRQYIADIQIRISLVGVLCSRLIQGRVFRILGMLLESRVGLLEALELARQTTTNRRFQVFFDATDEAVTTGGSVCGPMSEFSLINPGMVQAIRTGEQSGRLGESITYVADVLDEENTELLNVLTRLVEPAVLIVMGFVVGTVAISLFIPLFDLTSAV